MKCLKCLSDECDQELIPMKIIPECRDRVYECLCGASRGRYITGRKVEVSGPCEVWGVKRFHTQILDWQDRAHRILEPCEYIVRRAHNIGE